MKLEDLKKNCDDAPIGPWDRMTRDNIQFIATARLYMLPLIEIVEKTKAFLKENRNLYMECKNGEEDITDLVELIEKLEGA